MIEESKAVQRAKTIIFLMIMLLTFFILLSIFGAFWSFVITGGLAAWVGFRKIQWRS